MTGTRSHIMKGSHIQLQSNGVMTKLFMGEENRERSFTSTKQVMGALETPVLCNLAWLEHGDAIEDGHEE